MNRRFLIASLLAAVALASPAAAAAADTLIAPDPAAQQVTALDGTLVWVTGDFGQQKLMQRTPSGDITPVKGIPESRSFPSIDLGHDAKGKLRLTYLRCDFGGACKALWNDLDGRRATFRNLEPAGCTITAVSQWRTRVAYGLACEGSQANRKLSGLYVKTGSQPPKRLPRPKDAVKFRISSITSVDLRGTRVAAVAADVYQYSFSQTVAGKDMRSIFAAASEGDGDGDVRGIALPSASAHWTLANASHAGDPDLTILFRQTAGCVQVERRETPPGSPLEAVGLAVDGETLYLVKPAIGIVTHTFTPDPTGPC